MNLDTHTMYIDLVDCMKPYLDEPHDGAWGAVGVVVAGQLAHLGHRTIQRIITRGRRCGETKSRRMYTDT
jgi:hypothetical protein